MLYFLYNGELMSQSFKKPESSNTKGRDTTGSSFRVYQALHLFIQSTDDDTDKAIARLKLELERKVESQKTISASFKKEIQAAHNGALQKLVELKRTLSNQKYDEPVDALSVARKHFDERRYDQAHKLYQSALRQGHENLQILLSAGTAALYANDFPVALQRAGQVLERSSRDVQALTLKALALYSLDRLGEARTTIEEAMKLKPDSPIIQKYAKVILSNIAPSWNGERKWRRASMHKSLLIVDADTGVVTHHKTLSLSAGGCLVEADSLPNEFHFSLELFPGRKIDGSGERRYQQALGQYGLAFKELALQEMDAINQEVLKVGRT